MAEIHRDNAIDVSPVIAEEEVQRWLEDGYLVVPDLISPAEVDHLKQETLDLARGKYPSENLQPLPADLSDREVLQGILAIHHPHQISSTIVEFVKHPKIAGVLSQIVAAHLPYWDGSVKCMLTMLFVKPPGFQGEAWHQDETQVQTRDRSLTGAWVALDDATEDNGCLWVIPGSHRPGYLYPFEDHDQPDEFDSGTVAYGFDESPAIPVEVGSGSVVFFNGYLLHSSRKNRSDRYRRALVMHYMNAWSLLPWSNPDLPYPSTGDRRAIIQVAGIDPYAWKGLSESHRKPYLRRCQANIDRVPDQASLDDKG